MSGFSAEYAKRVLTYYLRPLVVDDYSQRPTELWLALYSDDPLVEASQVEITSTASCTRQAVAFGDPTAELDGSIYVANTNAVTFVNLPETTITHFGVCDASTGGNIILAHAVLTEDATPLTYIDVKAGDYLQLFIGSLKLGVS